MFDLSLAEMGVILVTATVVIGPKDLPIAIRKAARGWAKFKQFTNGVRAQIDASVLGEELRAAQAEVERESRIIYDEHGLPYETFSLDGIADSSRPARDARATPILPATAEVAEEKPAEARHE
jgi:sec-independent protein translocase protein TatB